MQNRKTQIECLTRYGALTANLEDILEFLFSEKLASRDLIRATKQNANLPKEIDALLQSLTQDNKLQLLEYEWTILPIERIKITLITDNVSKEFTFNY